MKCEICNRGPMEGVTLYRANEKGVKGIWRCSEHPNVASFTIEHDEEILAIEKALEGRNG
jgi:hypothetical protein